MYVYVCCVYARCMSPRSTGHKNNQKKTGLIGLKMNIKAFKTKPAFDFCQHQADTSSRPNNKYLFILW